MQATPTISMLQLFSPLRLLGPLSDRELRVASRRIRSYAVRSGYIVLLCVLILSAWYSLIGMPNNAMMAFGVSRASVVSSYVAVRILLFQFVAAQLLAALMLSSSLGDEMRRGTLGVLLTTPITSLHIVVGKLLSGLLQVVLLLGISLPALAILRCLGGLSWEEVRAGFCIVLSAAVFAGALSLLLSTYYPHPYRAISAGAVTYLVLFAGLPFVAICLVQVGVLNGPLTASLLDLLNPFRAIYRALPWFGRPPTAGTGSFFSWPIHCLIMAGLALAVSCVSVWRIRRVAARTVLPRTGSARAIYRLRGSPVAWKEDPSGRPWRRRGNLVIGAVALVMCVSALTMNPARRVPLASSVYYGFGGLWLAAILRLAISVAGGVAREKESGAWQVLLTTPLGERQILWGKAAAALRYNATLFLSLLVVQIGLVLSDGVPGKYLIAVFYVFFRLAAIGFVLGAGLYSGTRFRTATVAVAATIAAFLCVNYLIGGSYNPLFSWLWRSLLTNTGRWGTMYLMALRIAATMGVAFILNIVLGPYLLHRARRNVRVYVF